jgi:hypothetical protein
VRKAKNPESSGSLPEKSMFSQYVVPRMLAATVKVTSPTYLDKRLVTDEINKNKTVVITEPLLNGNFSKTVK